MAHAIAAGCFGSRRLCIDLGLPDAAQLAALVERYYQPEFAGQSSEDAWKNDLLDRAAANRNGEDA